MLVRWIFALLERYKYESKHQQCSVLGHASQCMISSQLLLAYSSFDTQVHQLLTYTLRFPMSCLERHGPISHNSLYCILFGIS